MADKPLLEMIRDEHFTTGIHQADSLCGGIVTHIRARCSICEECQHPSATTRYFSLVHLGPLFEKTGTTTKIWILDHNYVYWGRVISELDNPDFRRYVNSVAWHGYVGVAQHDEQSAGRPP